MNTPSLDVKGWMQTRLTLAHPHDGIDHARALCERHRINQLPVVADGSLVGIVTDRDLRDAFPSVGEQVRHPGEARRETAALRVEDVMTPNVLTVGERDPIERAATIMREERVGALPVVSGERLVGIVTRTDLLGALVALAATVRARA